MFYFSHAPSHAELWCNKVTFLVANFKENVQRCITVLNRRILCYKIKEEVSCNYRSWNKLLCFSRPTLGKMRTLKLQRKRQKLLVQKRYQNIISLVFRSTFSLSFDAHYCIRVNPPPGFHWRRACRVRGGLHLAGRAGQCYLRGPIPAGHRHRAALHCSQASWDRMQGRGPVCLPWCNRKGKMTAGHKMSLIYLYLKKTDNVSQLNTIFLCMLIQ